MKIDFIQDNKRLIAGTTLKDSTLPEDGNLALHAGKDQEKIINSRKKLMSELGISLRAFTVAAQTHSSNIYKVTAADKGRGSTTMDNAIPDTDGLYTMETGILLCTFTADCVPVIFYDKTQPLIGVIHSGWQGTIKEITPKMLHHLQNKENIDPANLVVHLGPAISQEKFEVDVDVYDQYISLDTAEGSIYYNDNTGKYHIDNQEVVKKQCIQGGVPESQITLDRTCTFLSPNHFSHRQDRSTGRHLSFIMMH